jgi:hypothetical protein
MMKTNRTQLKRMTKTPTDTGSNSGGEIVVVASHDVRLQTLADW